MPAGVNIRAADGSTQVTSEVVSFGLVTYGLLVLSIDSGGPQPTKTGSFSIAGDNPVLCIRPTAFPVHIVSMSRSGNTTTWTFRSVASDNVPVQYWVFDTATKAAKEASLTQAGLRVYDATGVLTFDAAALTMKVVNVIEMGIPDEVVGSYLGSESFTSIGQPAGKVYGVVFASPGFGFGMKDTGQYSNAQNPEEVIEAPEENPSGPQPGDTWRYKILESYAGMAKRVPGSEEASVGFGRFEFFQGWYPVDQEDHWVTYGKLQFMVVDLTNFPAADTGNTGPDYEPNPVNWTDMVASSTAPTVGFNGVERVLGGFNQPITLRVQTTQAPAQLQNPRLIFVCGGEIRGILTPGTNAFMDCTANPGEIGYFYMDAETTSGVKTGTFGVVVFNMSISGAPVLDSFNCTMTVDSDNNYNVVSTTIGDLGFDPQTSSSTSTYTSVGDVGQITGITQPVTLRFERYNYVGGVENELIYIYKGNSPTGPWGDAVATFSPRGTDQRFVEVVFNNGEYVRYQIDATANLGPMSHNFDFVVWNMSHPGGPLAVENNKITQTVGPDKNPNNFNFPDLTNRSTNDFEYAEFSSPRQITGIDTAVTLRFNKINFFRTQFINTARTEIYVGPSSTGPWTQYLLGQGVGAVRDVVVNPGDWIYTGFRINTSSGTASSSWTDRVISLDTGLLIDEWNVGGTIDADNNYNVTDNVPDAFNLSNLAINTTADYGGVSHGAGVAVTGINVPITVRFTRSGYSGNLSGHGLHLFKNDQNLGINMPWSGSGSIETTVNNGDRLAIYADASTSDGMRSGSVTVTVTNVNTGQQMDTFTVSATVDSDNNFNVADYTTDAMNWNDGGPATYQVGFCRRTTNVLTVTGINRTVQMQLNATMQFKRPESVTESAIYCMVNGQQAAFVYWGYNDPPPNQSSFKHCTFNVNNGDQVYFIFDLVAPVNNSGQGIDAYVDMDVYNMSLGGVLIDSTPSYAATTR